MDAIMLAIHRFAIMSLLEIMAAAKEFVKHIEASIQLYKTMVDVANLR